MKKKVVQLVSFQSVYNENLQANLRRNYKFASNFDIFVINFEDTMVEFESLFSFKPYNDNNFLNKIRYLFTLNRYLIKKYDCLKGSILHIQYVLPKYVFFIFFFKKNFTKTIITFWGSDLLRIDRNLKRIPLKILSWYSDIITFETKEFSNIFNATISNKFNNKIRIVDFGIQILDDIDRVTISDLELFKQKYGIDVKKKIVSVGYSRIIEHQHIAVVKSLIKTNICRDDICIVFPWTYGGEAKSYRESIESLINGKYDYVFIDKKLTNKEMAILRCATDILVHVETTDVMSFSMLETLYAKNVVITGSWLPYDDMYSEGVSMVCVNNVDEVGNKIKYLLDNQIDAKILKKNSDIIGKLYRWDNCINNWINLYK